MGYTGYRGEALRLLEEEGLSVGDTIKITTDGGVFEGTLIPRYELADDKHIVIKLKNGYNIGIRLSPQMRVERVGTGAKPAFIPPPPPKAGQGLPTVAIISTGGTIASRVDYRTGAVYPALSARDLYSVVPELSDIAEIRVEVLFSLFSENIHAPHWSEMAKTAARYIEDGVDGVVLCHGTDTMGYTAAALSFALQSLPVPVVIVGSQRSSDRPSSDAAMNLTNAVVAAGGAPFAEVALGMHGTVSDEATVLHRGTKARKCHTSRRDAFKSVNASPIARVEAGGVTMLVDDYVKRDKDRDLVLKPAFEEGVALIRFHPDLNPEVIGWYVDKGYRGIVLEGTGLGHVGKALYDPLERAMEGGLLIVMTSQCLWGRVNMNVYDTGMDLQALGVIPLGDMLPETALVKMMWVLGQTKNPEEARMLLLTNIAHEFSPKTPYRAEWTWP